jgi:hypothetical protein
MPGDLWAERMIMLLLFWGNCLPLLSPTTQCIPFLVIHDRGRNGYILSIYGTCRHRQRRRRRGHFNYL